MKTTIKLFLAAGLMTSLAACKNSDVPPASTVASFNFTNATVGVNPIVVQFNNKPLIFSTIAAANKLSYGVNNVFNPISGSVTVALIQTTDTTHNVFKGTLNLANHNIYSFFLAGTVSQPDTLLVHDNIPYYPATDSVGGVRFINLSSGSSPISVDIKGQANGSEVPSLAYKGLTNFKTYTATHTISNYAFEFRDAASGTLLASYTINGVNNSTGTNTSTNNFRFKNCTLALIGQPGGTAPQQVIMIKNYNIDQ